MSADSAAISSAGAWFDAQRSAAVERTGPSVVNRIGRYRVHQVIGRGGTSVVYRASNDHRRELPPIVAIKAADELCAVDVHEQFGVHSRVSAAVHHPNVLTIVDSGAEGGRPYLVMPHVAGADLARRLATGALTVSRVLTLLRQVAEGLDALHRAGVLHLDVKPSNILVGSALRGPLCGDRSDCPSASPADPGEERAYLTDLGLCRFLADGPAGFGEDRGGGDRLGREGLGADRLGQDAPGGDRVGGVQVGAVLGAGRLGQDASGGDRHGSDRPAADRQTAPGVDHERKGGGGVSDGVLEPGARGGDRGADRGSENFVGSPRYAAPEHLRGGALQPAADVYSLTCVLFACLAGRPPYVGDIPAIVTGHLSARVPSLAALTGLPRRIDRVIGRGMHPDPGSRFGSCRELLLGARLAISDGTG